MLFFGENGLFLLAEELFQQEDGAHGGGSGSGPGSTGPDGPADGLPAGGFGLGLQIVGIKGLLQGG